MTQTSVAAADTRPLFLPGDVLTHRKGGKYMVMYSPDECRIEKNIEPCYVYRCLADNSIWVRPQTEMEDGRFTLGPSRPRLPKVNKRQPPPHLNAAVQPPRPQDMDSTIDRWSSPRKLSFQRSNRPIRTRPSYVTMEPVLARVAP